MSKKESGAQGRKRRAQYAASMEGSSKLMRAFLGSSDNRKTDYVPLDGSKEDEIQDCETAISVEKGNIGITDACSVGGNITTNDGDVFLSKTNQQNDITNMRQDDILDIITYRDIGNIDFDITGSANVTHAQRMEIIRIGAEKFQNKDGPFDTKDGRSMTTFWFKRRLLNGQYVNRTWLLYSRLHKAAYCLCCLLFPSKTPDKGSAFKMRGGFSKWKKIEKLYEHENSNSHHESFATWKETERQHHFVSGVDEELQMQIQQEKNRWRDILRRLMDCLKYLASQNLAFRGHIEDINSSKNPGNFLSLLQLLAKYDPVMRDHLESVKNKHIQTTYLSPEIQNELLNLMASNVRNFTLSAIRRNKYYGIIFDSTPDLAHHEQLAQVIRFVDINYETRKVEVKESFIDFIQIKEKDAANIEKTICAKIETDGLSLNDCCSQCYDNAAVMSGPLSGVQQRILNKNPKAIFINCDNHSLNLACLHAASQEISIINFFGIIEAVYNFFVSSTNRWDELQQKLKISVKRLSETQWSAREEAVRVVGEKLDELMDLLEVLSEEGNTTETKCGAYNILQRMLSFDFLVLLGFWKNILSSINRVQKRLQDPKMNFREAAADLDSLREGFIESHDRICLESLEVGKKHCQTWGVNIERRKIRRSRLPGENSIDSGLTAEQEICRIMKAALDRLISEITNRFSRLRDLDSRFGFLLDIKTIIFDDSKENRLEEKCSNLAKCYPGDIEGHELYRELKDCKMLIRKRTQTDFPEPKVATDLLEFIICYGEDAFPNLRIALQILLTIGVSVASCERSFSKLKLIFTYLRTSMTQQRLNDLAMLSIEKDVLESLDFDSLIDMFATAKARKVHI